VGDAAWWEFKCEILVSMKVESLSRSLNGWGFVWEWSIREMSNGVWTLIDIRGLSSLILMFHVAFMSSK